MPVDTRTFLMIDERSGKLWKIPSRALVAQLSEPLAVSHQAWQSTFLCTSKDACAFLTAEVVHDLCGKNASSFPTHVFESCVEGHVVYTKAISIHNSRWWQYGEVFHWPVSFERHFDIGAQSDTSTEGEFIGNLGQPLSPALGCHNGCMQRPSPSFINGSELVSDYETELDAPQREFYLSACCAPYLYRDSLHSLEQYWRSTKRHKEHHPNRLALKHRMKREEERRKLDSVNTLLERSHDPKVVKLVVRNAKRGIRVLSELMQNSTAECDCCKRRKVTFTSFFGEGGLPFELQRLITEMCVVSTLSSFDSSEAWGQFKSMRLASKFFHGETVYLADAFLKGASNDLCGFVYKGVPMRHHRMEALHYWTYREFGCSPTVLMDLTSASSLQREHRPPWQIYFKARLASSLASNVCRQRAIVKTHSCGSTSDRLERLRRIVMYSG